MKTSQKGLVQTENLLLPITDYKPITDEEADVYKKIAKIKDEDSSWFAHLSDGLSLVMEEQKRISSNLIYLRNLIWIVVVPSLLIIIYLISNRHIS